MRGRRWRRGFGRVRVTSEVCWREEATEMASEGTGGGACEFGAYGLVRCRFEGVEKDGPTS